MTEYIEVQTTTASAEEADRIAGELLESRLAACVQVSGPIRSRYWWQGRLEESSEWVCTAKTHSRLFQSVETAIRKAHSYDEPQIVATAIVQATESYLQWIKSELTPRDDSIAK